MTTEIRLFHFGPGKIGKTLLRQLIDNKKSIEQNFDIRLNISGIFNSSSYLYDINGLTNSQIEKASSQKTNHLGKFYHQRDIWQIIGRCCKLAILVDTTASEQTKDLLLTGLRKGCFVVLSNKKPLSSDYQTFQHLFQYQHRLFFETTVGAGLPIISTSKELLSSGDEIVEIKGCFSGTLGFIFSLLSQGKSFSHSVRQANKLGYTEPDPRDDLSGIDVARKTLILARLIYRKEISLENIHLQSLYPQKLKDMSVNNFLKKISLLDENYRKLMKKARENKNTLKYVAKINKLNISIGLQQVPLESDIGNLNGPDNIVVIRSKRYLRSPLVIKGPGAGLEVTAGGVLADILKIIRIIKGDKL